MKYSCKNRIKVVGIGQLQLKSCLIDLSELVFFGCVYPICNYFSIIVCSVCLCIKGIGEEGGIVDQKEIRYQYCDFLYYLII